MQILALCGAFFTIRCRVSLLIFSSPRDINSVQNESIAMVKNQPYLYKSEIHVIVTKSQKCIESLLEHRINARLRLDRIDILVSI